MDVLALSPIELAAADKRAAKLRAIESVLAEKSKEQANRSYMAYLGGITKTSNRALARINNLSQEDRDDPTVETVREIREAIENIRHAAAMVQAALARTQDADADTPENDRLYTEKGDHLMDTLDNTLAPLLELREELSRKVYERFRPRPAAAPPPGAPQHAQQPVAPIADAGAALVAAFNRPQTVNSLKPKTLKRSFTPVEYDFWKSRVQTYFETGAFDTMTPKNQQQMLFTLVDASIWNQLESLVTDTTPVLPDPFQICVLDLITEHIFLQKYPLFDRRWRLMRHRPHAGQSYTDFCTETFKLSSEAKTEQMTSEDWIIMLIISNIDDKRLVRKLLEQKELTKAQLLLECETHERVVQSTGMITNRKGSNIEANAISSRRPRDPQRTGWSRPSWHRTRSSTMRRAQNSCGQCGSSRKHDRADCPAKSAECRACKKRGHYEAVCRSSGRRRKSNSPYSSSSRDRRNRSNGSRDRRRSISRDKNRRPRSLTPGPRRNRSPARANAVEVFATDPPFKKHLAPPSSSRRAPAAASFPREPPVHLTPPSNEVTPPREMPPLSKQTPPQMPPPPLREPPPLLHTPRLPPPPEIVACL